MIQHLSYDLPLYTSSMPKRIIKTNEIVKTSDTHKTVTYVVLEPDTPDLDGDYISETEIIKTAHEFVLNLWLKKVNFNHEENTDTDEAKFVESFVAPVDIEVEGGIIKKWSWMVAFKFSDELYQKVVDGKIVWVSLEWFYSG